MVDDENGRARALEFVENLRELFRRLGVEVRARFVEHQDLGAERENAGEPHLLLLAFRERMNVGVEKMRDPERFGRALEARVHIVGRHPAALERKADFVPDVQGEELFFRVLEERPHLFGEVRHGGFRDVAVVDPHRPRHLAPENLGCDAVG